MRKKKEYLLGDMILHYEWNEAGNVGLILYPAACPLPEMQIYETGMGTTKVGEGAKEHERICDGEKLEKQAALDPLVQVKLTGDMYQGAFAPGHTLRCAESTRRLVFESQRVKKETAGSGTGSQRVKKDIEETVIETVLKDDRGYEAVHRVHYREGDRFLTAECTYENNSDHSIQIEMLSSFSITGISPYLAGDCYGDITLHRLQSRWSQEGRLLSQTIEDLQLEPGWNMDSVRCERFGQAGSMPVSEYFPFLAVEDTRNHVFWGAQLSHPASWQMEIYRNDENIAISGGLADREFGHWMKKLEPGESITTPTAILTTAHTESIDILSQRLVEYGVRGAEQAPECEQNLPIIFNEYCTTWGNPSHENIVNILNAIRGKGFDYFVIDCGWYKADGVPWDISMGDYIPSRTLFPEGLEKTVEAIHQEGLKAGIWFEMENVGPASEAFHNEQHLLKRDGAVLTTSRRRFWNMSDPWVKDYLREKVIGTLKKYGFDYMKVDYNDTIGIGCDGAESLGEGLRRNMMETMAFFEEIKGEVPGIILENCASGGHRLEPGFMAATSMASFSDAHECVEIPIVAANVHRAILPRQSQIWAVIRESDSLKRIAYSVASTFLGRMCISGDVINLTDAQWDVIDRGIAFYRLIAPIIKDGQTYRVSPQIKRMRHPEGWQGVIRVGRNGEAYALIHTFGGSYSAEIRMKLPDEMLEQGDVRQRNLAQQESIAQLENLMQNRAPEKRIAAVYSDTEEKVWIENGELCCQMSENWKALAVYLK